MFYVGVDLHKQVIRLCVIQKVRDKREIVARRKFACRDTERMRAFFEGLGRFQVVVEATASYEWFFLLIEDLADRLVLAHPKKLRVIAESARKTDKIDAEVLAVFLALDMIPEAYRPSPRIRQYRVLVRHRRWISRRITAAKAKIRNKAAQYNADIAELFTQRGNAYLAELALGASDRFETDALLEQLELFKRQLNEVDAELTKFAKNRSAGRAGGTGDSREHSVDWTGDDRRGAQRIGRLAPFSRGQSGGRLRRFVPGSPRERRPATRTVDHQGGLTAVAMGDGPGGVAFGDSLAPLEPGCIFACKKIQGRRKRRLSAWRGSCCA